MNKSNSKKQIRKIITVLLIISVILIMIVLVMNFISQESKSRKKLSYINGEEWNNELYPEGMPKLFRYYSGELKSQNIGKSIDYLINDVIPKYHTQLKELSNEEIEKYYKKHKKTIYLDIGEIEVNKFVLLIKQIKGINNQSLEIEEYYIDKDSIVMQNNSTEADLYIKYKNSDGFFVKMQVLNKFKDDVSSVKYYK